MALAVSGTPYRICEVSLRDKPPEMLAASPKGTVPVLLLSTGEVVDESLDIMRWALDRSDPEHWLDGDDSLLIEQNDGPFKRHLDRYKYPDRHGSDPEEHKRAAVEILSRLDERLRLREWLCGQTRSLTDAALFPFVRQFAAVDRSWFETQPLPHLQRWLATQLACPLFLRVMTPLRAQQAG